jgi:hypothetical protein
MLSRSIADHLNEGNLGRPGWTQLTGVADLLPDRIRRLVYWNAFVPNNGECLNDMVPPHYVGLFGTIAAQRGDGSVVRSGGRRLSMTPTWRPRSAHMTSSIHILTKLLLTRFHSRPIPPT